MGIVWENTTPSTESPCGFCAGIGPLQLGVVLVSWPAMYHTKVCWQKHCVYSLCMKMLWCFDQIIISDIALCLSDLLSEISTFCYLNSVNITLFLYIDRWCGLPYNLQPYLKMAIAYVWAVDNHRRLSPWVPINLLLTRFWPNCWTV